MKKILVTVYISLFFVACALAEINNVQSFTCNTSTAGITLGYGELTAPIYDGVEYNWYHKKDSVSTLVDYNNYLVPTISGEYFYSMSNEVCTVTSNHVIFTLPTNSTITGQSAYPIYVPILVLTGTGNVVYGYGNNYEKNDGNYVTNLIKYQNDLDLSIKCKVLKIHSDPDVVVYLRIFDPNGKTLFNFQGNEVDISNLLPGMYIIKLYSFKDRLILTKKFLVQ